jgi:hypothetical protein
MHSVLFLFEIEKKNKKQKQKQNIKKHILQDKIILHTLAVHILA